jgi:excisionase family DNA binding protein
LTTRQVAERLNLSAASVLRRYRAGELPGFRLATNVLRFRGTDIDEWLEAHRG